MTRRSEYTRGYPGCRCWLTTVTCGCPAGTYISNKGKCKGPYTWYSASSWIITSEALRYGRVLKGSNTVTCTLTRSSAIGKIATSYCWYSFTDPRVMEMAVYAVFRFTCPKAVTHPTTKRAQCSIDRDQRFTATLYIATASYRVSQKMSVKLNILEYTFVNTLYSTKF